MSNQDSQNFKSLDELTAMAASNVNNQQQKTEQPSEQVQQAPVTQAVEQQPTPVQEEPQVTASPKQDQPVTVNSTQYAQNPSAPLQPTLASDEATPNKEMDKAIEATKPSTNPITEEAKKYAAPELEATLAEDEKREAADNTRSKVRNPTVDEMRKLRNSVDANTEQSSKVAEVLKNAVIDLNNITIEDTSSDPLALHKQVELVSSSTPKISFPIICLKSGYKADLSPLTNNEKIEAYNLNGSIIDVTLKLAKLVHSKITDTSVGRLRFDRFLNITAESEFDTLLYGIYCASFPDATTYTVKCQIGRAHV